ncbi:hypothetical protein OC842_001932 [Tilletia horrida]|uniref:Deoxyribonuclease NucA/NucB domain-containing protein n=1 Tax=Tilletia horrida TaxID=155126 RepID=A0AAN6GGW5_9BASI|nr:hypothetical protein OC842_001932 [Tilletia horrida]
MKTAFLSLLSLCTVSLTVAIPSLTFNCRAYPDVCDHHVYANGCANFRFVLPQNGFHRDGNADDSISSKRRRAVGCGGVTNCGDNSDCDEIPYASTYDGGLGCYGVSAGYKGPQSDLYNRGSHHCVNRSQNRRHGNTVKQFYADSNIGDSQKLWVLCLIMITAYTVSNPYLTLSIPSSSSFAPIRSPSPLLSYITVERAASNYPSGTFGYKQAVVETKYRNAKTRAAQIKLRAQYQANCLAYAQTGQQAILSRSSRSGVCPDKNTARWATNRNTTAAVAEDDDDAFDSARSDNGNAAAIAAAAADGFGLDQPRQVLTLSSGTEVYALYGAPEFKLGYNVTLHGDKPVDAEGNFHTWNETVVGIHFD